MTIHIRVFHSEAPLYGRQTPPDGIKSVRRARIADGDGTLRSVKRYTADGKRIVVKVADMCGCYNVTISTSINEGLLFSGMVQDGRAFCVKEHYADDEWWVVLSCDAIDLDGALQGYRFNGEEMTCMHDEIYAAEVTTDSEHAYCKWAAAEQIASDRDDLRIAPRRPVSSMDEMPQSWGYCKSVLSAQLAEKAAGHNGAIPIANIFAALQALAACSSGETRDLIESLIGKRWASKLKPFEILGLTPGSYCSPKYRANIATSSWIAERFIPEAGCLSELSALDILQETIADDLSITEARMSAWVHEKTLGEFRPKLKLDHLVEFAIVSAMFFKDAWNDAFEISDGEHGAFFGNEGVRTIGYMRGLREGSVSRFERCKAASLRLTTGASVVFVLPDREVELSDLLRTGEAIEAAAAHVTEYGRDYDVDWWLPKFDVTGSIGGGSEKLIPGIKGFSPGPDFSPIAGRALSLLPTFAGEARVKIDEEGIEAAGYAMFAVAEAGIHDEPPVAPFVIDRPFAFVLVSSTKEPMFMGAVNHPEGY